MNREELEREFKDRAGTYRSLQKEALFTLKKRLGRAKIKYHSVTARVKDPDSLFRKAQRKQAGNPFEEINDIVGLRVVCLFISDLARICEEMREVFQIVREDNKLEDRNVSSFGYMSVHFVATMKKEYTGPRYEDIAGLKFEIQARTIAMDAWANISHHLDYKSETDIPDDLKRDFYALSGLFYVVDKHFEMFYTARKKSFDDMSRFFKRADPESRAAQAVNRDSLVAYLRVKLRDRKPAEDDADYSRLVGGLLQAGYGTIGDLERILDGAWEAFLLYEKDYPPEEGRFSDAMAVDIAARMSSEKYLRIRAEQMYVHPVRVARAVAEENELYEDYRKFIKVAG